MLVTEDSGFDKKSADGVLGLAYSEVDNVSSFMQTLQKNSNDIITGFSLYLNDIGDNTGYGTPASNLQINGSDLAKYSTSGLFLFESLINLDYSPLWSVFFESVTIMGCYFSSVNLAFDTTESLIVTDSTSFTSIYMSAVEVLDGCTSNGILIECNCKEDGGLPALQIFDGNFLLTIPSERLWLKDSGKCTLLIKNGNKPYWILGAVFFNSYYTFFSMYKSIGVAFAPAAYSNWTTSGKTTTGLLLALFALVF